MLLYFKRWLALGCFGFFILLSMNTWSQTTAPFNKIVIFGDSLSDNGNLYNYFLHFMPKSPPYYSGRFTNDYTWSDRVAQHYSQQGITTENYAVGGSVTLLHGGLYLPWSLGESIDSYLSPWFCEFRDCHAPDEDEISKTLYIIWIGANDYLQGAENVDEYTNKVVDTINDRIKQLINLKARNFLVVNLPSLANTPYANTISKDLKNNLQALTDMHNQKLARMVEALQALNNISVKVKLYDSNAFFKTMRDNLPAFNTQFKTNLKDMTDACWTGGYTLEGKKQNFIYSAIQQKRIQMALALHLSSIKKNNAALNDTAPTLTDGYGNTLTPAQASSAIAYSPVLNMAYTMKPAIKGMQNSEGKLVKCVNQKDADTYVFWDKVHPGGVIHKVMSEIFIDYITKNWG